MKRSIFFNFLLLLLITGNSRKAISDVKKKQKNNGDKRKITALQKLKGNNISAKSKAIEYLYENLDQYKNNEKIKKVLYENLKTELHNIKKRNKEKLNQHGEYFIKAIDACIIYADKSNKRHADTLLYTIGYGNKPLKALMAFENDVLMALISEKILEKSNNNRIRRAKELSLLLLEKLILKKKSFVIKYKHNIKIILKIAFKNHFSGVRNIASRIMRLFPDDKNIQKMYDKHFFYQLKQLSNKNRSKKIAAIKNLGEIGDKRAIPLLISELNKKDNKLQNKITWALYLIIGKHLGQKKEKWLEWWKRYKKK